MKKKFIVVFLVTVSFVVGSFTGVFADYTPTNDAYTLVNYLNGKVIIAGYKGNKLVAMEINDYSEDFKPVVLDGDIDKVKVMVWDDNAKMEQQRLKKYRIQILSKQNRKLRNGNGIKNRFRFLFTDLHIKIVVFYGAVIRTVIDNPFVFRSFRV